MEKLNAVLTTAKLRLEKSLLRTKRRISRTVDKVKGWPLRTKIIAGVTAACLLFASVGGVWYGLSHRTVEVEPEEVILVEEEPEEEVVEEEIIEEEEEEEEAEIIELAEITNISFGYVKMSYTSMEKDIDLYFLNANGKKITGQVFSAKIVSTSDAATLSSYTSAIATAKSELATFEEEYADVLEILEQANAVDDADAEAADGEDTDSTDATDDDTATITAEEADEYNALAEEYAALQLARAEAISAYATALDALSGTVLTDNNANGAISEEGLESGNFVVCYVPNDAYLPDSLTLKVTIKDQLEYVVVDVTEKVEEYSAAEDTNPATTPTTTVEATLTDTVDYVTSSTKEVAAVYSEASDVSNAPVAASSQTFSSSTSSTTLYSGVASANSVTISGLSSHSTVTATSADTSVATADYSDGAVTITAGDVSSTTSTIVTITASTGAAEVVAASSFYTILNKLTFGFSGLLGRLFTPLSVLAAEESNATTMTITVNVVGSDTVLTDADGNTLYTDTNGTVATVGTYSSLATYYYISEEAYIIYYGWQIIDGVRYYYNSNGVVVTGEQVIDGVKYTFASDGALQTSGTGIDVSYWQGSKIGKSIDWSQVKTTASFAIVRVGFRGSDSHNIAADPDAVTNITGANAAGLKVGLYFYSRAVNEKEAVEEASYCISIAQQTGGISYPIFIDMESDDQKSLTNAERTAIITAFCETVQSAGYKAGVYANLNWLTNYINASSLSSSIYVWCAQYNTACEYTGRYDIWQYSKSGTVPGISGNVDMNISYFGN